MMIEISDLLFLRTSEKRSDAILFILADLINKIGPEGQGQNNCVKYANLNLIAGEKALQIPNFESAKVHFESGITFLGEDCWSKEYYRLSLALFKNAAFSQYARGKTDMYKKRLNEVLDNASSFADKVESLTLMIQSLTMDGELALAFEKSLVVLEQLGETFPKSPPANDVIVRELRAAKDQLEAYEPSTISNSIPQMTDPQKMCAMVRDYVDLNTYQYSYGDDCYTHVFCSPPSTGYFPFVIAAMLSHEVTLLPTGWLSYGNFNNAVWIAPQFSVRV